MITSTMTRPTSIGPTSTCDQKLSFVEIVDIGPLVPPEPQTISLEPISRKARRKKVERQRQNTSHIATDIGSGSETPKMAGSPHPDDSASQCGDLETVINSRSPVPSEMVSTVSAATGSSTSSSTGLSFRLGPVPASAKSKSQQGESTVSAADKTITAKIELQKSGCLPGESFPLKILIKHTKAIKSMHGIIITLYRQGRIDSAPPLSMFMDIKGKAAEKLKHEEYYPKSKTGLGGLSLSSAGSSSLFRKDLAQTFAPILVDPVTLSTTIQASVRCPEDVFPTIAGVPGEMISFKYYVEVVVDLGGKLAGQQMHVPKVGGITIPSGRQDTMREGSANILAAWGGSIVETDQIRREKSVVACLFEVTIGTIDSERKKNKEEGPRRTEMNGWPEDLPVSPGFIPEPIYEDLIPTYHQRGQPPGVPPGAERSDYRYHDGQYPTYYENNDYDYQNDDGYSAYPPGSQAHVPPPEVAAEEGLSEKDRARRAEERLLPSAPRIGTQESSSSRTFIHLSAPSAPGDDLDDLYDADDPIPPAPSYAAGPSEHILAPSAPTLEDLAPSAGENSYSDKQEIERQRMLAEASAPPDFLADEDHNGDIGSSSAQHEPSAPIFTEDDEYGGQHSHTTIPGPSHHAEGPRYPESHDEELPRYER
jgi:hypothetical protein